MRHLMTDIDPGFALWNSEITLREVDHYFDDGHEAFPLGLEVERSQETPFNLVEQDLVVETQNLPVQDIRINSKAASRVNLGLRQLLEGVRSQALSKKFRAYNVGSAFLENLETSQEIQECQASEHTQITCARFLHIVTHGEFAMYVRQGRTFPMLLRQHYETVPAPADLCRELKLALVKTNLQHTYQQDLSCSPSQSPSHSVPLQRLDEDLATSSELPPGKEYGYQVGMIPPHGYLALPQVPSVAGTPLYQDEVRRICLLQRYQDQASGMTPLEKRRLSHLQPGTGLAFPCTWTGQHQDSGAASETTIVCLSGYKLLLLYLKVGDILRQEHEQYGDELRAPGAFHLLLRANESVRFAYADDGRPVIHSALSLACGGTSCKSLETQGLTQCCSNKILMAFQHLLHPRHIVTAAHEMLRELKNPHITNTGHSEDNLALLRWAMGDMVTDRKWWQTHAPDVLDGEQQQHLEKFAKAMENALDAMKRPKKRSKERLKKRAMKSRSKGLEPALKRQCQAQSDPPPGRRLPNPSNSTDGQLGQDGLAIRRRSKRSPKDLNTYVDCDRVAQTEQTNSKPRRYVAVAETERATKRSRRGMGNCVEQTSSLAKQLCEGTVDLFIDLGNTNIVAQVVDGGSCNFIPFGDQQKLGGIGTHNRVLCNSRGEIVKVCDQITEEDDPELIIKNLKIARPSDGEGPHRDMVQKKLAHCGVDLDDAMKGVMSFIFGRMIELNPIYKERRISVTVGEPNLMDGMATDRLRDSVSRAAESVGLQLARFATRDEAVMAAVYASDSSRSDGLRRIVVVDIGGMSIDMCSVLTHREGGKIRFLHVYHGPWSSDQAAEVFESDVVDTIKRCIRRHYPEMTDDTLDAHAQTWVINLYRGMIFPKPIRGWMVSSALRHNTRDLGKITMEELFAECEVRLNALIDGVRECIRRFIEEEGKKYDKFFHSETATMANYSRKMKDCSEQTPPAQKAILRDKLDACRKRREMGCLKEVYFVGGGFVCPTLREKATRDVEALGWQVRDQGYEGRTAVVKGLVISQLGLECLKRLDFWYAVWGDNFDLTAPRKSAEGIPRRAGWTVVARQGDSIIGDIWRTHPWNLSDPSASKVVMDGDVSIYRFSQDPSTLAEDDLKRMLFLKLSASQAPRNTEAVRQRTVLYPADDEGPGYHSLAYQTRWMVSLHRMTFELVLPPLRNQGNVLDELVLNRKVAPITQWGSF